VGCAMAPVLPLPACVVAGWYGRWTWSGKVAERAEDGYTPYSAWEVGVAVAAG
jgi:hypothetical protein